MGDEDHAQAPVPRLRDIAQYHGCLLDPEGRGRLVEDKDLRPEVHGAGDGHRLALAAGEGAHRLGGVADVYAHPAQLLAGDPVGVGRVVAFERTDALRRLAPEEEVAGDAHKRDHRQVLVDGGYAAVEGVARRAEADLVALD